MTGSNSRLNSESTQTLGYVRLKPELLKVRTAHLCDIRIICTCLTGTIRQCRFRGVLQYGLRTHMHGLLDMRDLLLYWSLVVGDMAYSLRDPILQASVWISLSRVVDLSQ